MFTPDHVRGEYGLIAHALGGIDGVDYTNSREALLASHAAGFRLIEVDLCLTADDEVVCYHEHECQTLGLPRPIGETTRQEFLSCGYQGGYTPLDLEQLCHLVDSLPGFHLVLDTKNENASIVPRLEELAAGAFPKLLQRVIPQAYSREDVAWLRARPWVDQVIFTCYLCDYDNQQLVELAGTDGVAMVAMFENRSNPELCQALHELGRGVYFHTINDAALAQELRHKGIGVYTDYLLPQIKEPD